MSKTKGTQLNCFSPPVMVATLIIEMSLALYTLWRYKMTSATRLIVSLLISLAVFQMAEYFVCTGYGFRAEQWSRLGFVAISMMPPIGLHLMHVLAGKPKRLAVNASYLTLAGFVGFFLTYHTAFIGYKCTGNYVIFQMGARLGGTFAIYYYGWLATGVMLGVRWANEFLEQGKKGRIQLEMVRALIVGYLVFLIPTALANSVKPETRQGIPSIMCGFAVILALILALYILPRAAKIPGLVQPRTATD
jgi:hypothetical protein